MNELPELDENELLRRLPEIRKIQGGSDALS